MDVDRSLLTAVRYGKLKAAKELIDTYGLSYSEDWGNGYDLLRLALEYKNEKVAQLLLKKGSEVNSENYHNTPLHLAARNGDIKTIEMLLNKNARIEAKNKDGGTPLISTLQYKQSKAAELLIKRGANVNTIDNCGGTPLHHAIMRGLEEITKMLVANGANVIPKMERVVPLGYGKRRFLGRRTYVVAKERDGSTPLHLAVLQNFDNETIIMLLNKGVDVNAKQTNGSTALHFAAQQAHQGNQHEIIKTLLTRGSAVNAKSKDGSTPLHLAIHNHYSNHDVIETLLKFGADINSRDKKNRTIFYSAFKHTDVETVEILLEHGCDIDDLVCSAEVDAVNFYFYKRNTFEYDKTYLLHSYKSEQIQHHIVKRLAANSHVSKQHLESMDVIIKNKMSDFHLQCKNQIINMKAEKINNTNISFYDILAKATSSLADDLRNENVMEVLESGNYERKFPIYANMIKCNFQKGMARKQFLEQSNNIFLFFSKKFVLPYECTEKILSYVSNSDIIILINTFKPLTFSSPNK